MADDDPKAEAHLIESIRRRWRRLRRRTNAPFGAVITRQGKIVARAVNQVDDLCDPTAHAEMQAVRAAAKALNSTDLSGCTVYAERIPLPDVLTAMYLSGVEKVYYAYSNEDGAPYGLSAERGYVEIARPPDQREMSCRGFVCATTAKTSTKPGTRSRRALLESRKATPASSG